MASPTPIALNIIPGGPDESITRVIYNFRHACDQYLDTILEVGAVKSMSFGQMRDPCESLFRKILSTFNVMRRPEVGETSNQHVGVTVQRNIPERLAQNRPGEEPGFDPSIKNLWLKMDNSRLQEIDSKTLEPIQIVRQDAFNRSLKGPFSGAHSRTDPETGDLYNYNLETGRHATYRIFCVSVTTGKTSVLATISDSSIQPAYIHSMFLAQHYVVLCVFNAYYAAGALKILWTLNILEAMYFTPTRRTNGLWSTKWAARAW